MNRKKAAFRFKLQGYTRANRDTEIEITHTVSGKKIRRKFFRDGTLTISDLEPGSYEMVLFHPNLLLPITEKVIRLFPQQRPTYIPIFIPESLFRDTPIRDIPDADLSPILQSTQSVRERLLPMADKEAGEIFHAGDWNALVEVVGELTGAVQGLADLVSPRGHDHPEIYEKIAEVQGNIRRFSSSFGQSIVEMQRQLKTRQMEKVVDDVLTEAGQTEGPTRQKYDTLFEQMRQHLQDDTASYSKRIDYLAHQILGDLPELAAKQGANAEAFWKKPAVVTARSIAEHYAESGGQAKAEDEMNTHRKVTATTRTGPYSDFPSKDKS